MTFLGQNVYACSVLEFILCLAAVTAGGEHSLGPDCNYALTKCINLRLLF